MSGTHILFARYAHAFCKVRTSLESGTHILFARYAHAFCKVRTSFLQGTHILSVRYAHAFCQVRTCFLQGTHILSVRMLHPTHILRVKPDEPLSRIHNTQQSSSQCAITNLTRYKFNVFFIFTPPPLARELSCVLRCEWWFCSGSS